MSFWKMANEYYPGVAVSFWCSMEKRVGDGTRVEPDSEAWMDVFRAKPGYELVDFVGFLEAA